jgi:hypothetical protein
VAIVAAVVFVVNCGSGNWWWLGQVVVAVAVAVVDAMALASAVATVRSWLRRGLQWLAVDDRGLCVLVGGRWHWQGRAVVVVAAVARRVLVWL